MNKEHALDVGQFVVIVASVCGLFWMGYYKGYIDAKDGVVLKTTENVVPPTSSLAKTLSSSLSPAAGGPITPPSDYELRHEAASKRKYGAIERCEKEGGVPDLGWGYSVICLKKEAVRWDFDPDMPPLAEGLP